MRQLKIYQAFQNLIPPLSDDEYSGLENSILSHGRCRDTIKIWKGTIVDGHNRYAICQKHGIKYEVQDMRFSSIKDAELWIIQNQLGRRNLTNAMRIKLVLHKGTLLREKARQNRKGSNGSPVHVHKTLAKEAGVSDGTLYKYMRIRELGSPELVQQVESGEVKIGTAYKGLEVTTRAVERFLGSDSYDIGNMQCRKAVVNGIGRIEKVIGFISGNAVVMKDEGGLPRVFRRLEMQHEAVDMISVYESPMTR